MRRTWIIAPLLFAVFGTGGRADEPLVEQVRVAIEKGTRFLRNAERGRGSWEHIPPATGKSGGHTALAMLALLNSGVKSDDAIIQRCLPYLRNVPRQDTYVVGLQTMVFAEIGDPGDKIRIQDNVNWLIESRKMKNGKL